MRFPTHYVFLSFKFFLLSLCHHDHLKLSILRVSFPSRMFLPKNWIKINNLLNWCLRRKPTHRRAQPKTECHFQFHFQIIEWPPPYYNSHTTTNYCTQFKITCGKNYYFQKTKKLSHQPTSLIFNMNNDENITKTHAKRIKLKMHLINIISQHLKWKKNRCHCYYYYFIVVCSHSVV